MLYLIFEYEINSAWKTVEGLARSDRFPAVVAVCDRKSENERNNETSLFEDSYAHKLYTFE